MKFSSVKENNFISSIVCTVLVGILSILYSRFRRYRAIQALKKQYGCKEATKYHHEDKVMGSDMVRERTKAMTEGRFFRLYSEQFKEYGKTFEEIWRGKPLINTIDPVNVQKMAAIAFEDYGKDPERSIAQAPFLGPSIFDDGPTWKHARALVKPIFSRAEMSDMEHMESYFDRFMALLPDDGSMVDMQPLLHRLVSQTQSIVGN
jgi:cytochrome P450 monooxygenase